MLVSYSAFVFVTLLNVIILLYLVQPENLIRAHIDFKLYFFIYSALKAVPNLKAFAYAKLFVYYVNDTDFLED